MDDRDIEKWLQEYEELSRKSVEIIERGGDDSVNSERRIELLTKIERKLQTYTGSPEFPVIYDEIEERAWRGRDLITLAIRKREAAIRASIAKGTQGSNPGVSDSP